jgi:hypothetical protein
MADVIYNSFKKRLMQKDIDLANDTITVMLVASGYAPDADAHEFKSDVTSEVSGTGYTAGGAALANKTITQDNTDDEGVFDADDAVWANSEITARGAVIYKDTGVATTSPLVCYIDFGADKTTYGTDFKIQWAAEGILNVN